MQITYNQLKKMSKDLSNLLKEEPQDLSHSRILESFSNTLGYNDFNALSCKLKAIENTKNSKNIDYKKWLTILQKNQSEIKYKNHFLYTKREKNTIDGDEERYIEPLEMNLYDFCTLYFKRTIETRKYYTMSNYFDLQHFDGNVVISIKPDKEKNESENISDFRFSNEYYNKMPIFFAFKNDNKIKRGSTFEVVFFIDGANILLEYVTVEDFALDMLDFSKNSDFHYTMHPEDFKDLMLKYSAMFKSFLD